LEKKLKALKITIVAILSLIVMLGIFSGCEKKNDDTIKIGAILPLTGRLSVIGEGEKYGLQMAIDSLKIKFPERKFELIIEDFASDTKNAVTIANKLIDIDKVFAIITSTTAAAEAVTPIIDKKKIIHFVISPDIEILDKSIYNFRIYYNFKTEAKVFNDYVDKNNIKSIAFLAVRYSSIEKEIEENIVPVLAAQTSIVSKEYFDISENDFKNYLIKINNKNPELIFLAPQVNQVELLANTIKELKLLPSNERNYVCSFTFNWRSVEFINSLEGFYIISPLFQIVEPSNPYFKNFKNKFNIIPNFDMMFAYDNLMILGNILSNSTTKYDIFKKSFNDLGEYYGASGKINFVGNNDTDVEIILTKIVNKKQTRVE